MAKIDLYTHLYPTVLFKGPLCLVGEHGIQSLLACACICICTMYWMESYDDRGKKEFPKSFSSMGSGYSDSENNFECHEDLGFSEIS